MSGVLFYIDTQQRTILCRYIKVHRDARLYRYKTTYDFISIRQRTTLYVNRCMPIAAPPKYLVFAWFRSDIRRETCAGEKFAPPNLGNESPLFSWRDHFVYFPREYCHARDYGTPGMHACFSAKSRGRGGGGEGRNEIPQRVSRKCDVLLQTTTRSARAKREAETTKCIYFLSSSTFLLGLVPADPSAVVLYRGRDVPMH